MDDGFWGEGNGGELTLQRDPWGRVTEVEATKIQDDASLGLWSRSLLFRIIVWILMIQIAVVASLFAAAFICEYDSMFDMMSAFAIWLGIGA